MYLLNRDGGSGGSGGSGIFTFHYVSIKSFINAYYKSGEFDLHSTMYLLNHTRVCVNAPRSSNLHSTMYLLNHVTDDVYMLCHKFTFHYVSIKSLYPLTVDKKLFDLHSTMYLLNRASSGNTSLSCMTIYIPLCIY